MTAENEGYTFAQIGRTISEEWKKVEGDKLDKLKEEAERLNFDGVKKLPKEEMASDSDSDSWSEDEDPSFDETNVKKPIMLKIKREQAERTSRQRKRPSFFQDYENEENNLDKILDEFEQEQIMEARKPREPKPKKEVKNPGSRPRKRKQDSAFLDEEKEIDLETSRSGRVRKIRRRKVFAFDEEEDESHTDDEDRDEYKPDSEPEEPEEEYIDEEPSEPEEEGEEDENGYKLPLKKRKGGQMTKEEIEEAKRAAFAAKPHIVVDSKKLKGKDYRDEIDSIIKPGEEDNLDFSDDELSQVLKMQVKKEQDALPLDDLKPMGDDQLAESLAEEKLSSSVPEDVSLNTPVSNPEDMDQSSSQLASTTNNEEGKSEEPTSSNTEPASTTTVAADAEQLPPSADGEAPSMAKDEGGDLEGSVTEEDPPPNPFDSDNEVVDDEPVVPEEEDPAAVADNDEAPPTTTSEDVLERVTEEASSSEQPPTTSEAAADMISSEPIAPTSDEPVETSSSNQEPMDTDKSAANNDDFSNATEASSASSSSAAPAAANDGVVNENGQNSLDSEQHNPISAEEDLLTSTEATNMEEGDEQYKNMIAESQMDNIFN